MTRLTRRRFLAISAAAGLSATRADTAPTARWRGIALGARAEMRLVGMSGAEAAPIFEAVEAELTRLEDIFSLYRATSAVSTLNRDGVLDAPPAELLQVCSLATALHRASGGAFDPTVQPLWSLAARAVAEGTLPSDAEIIRARALVNWSNLRFDTTRIAFAHAGMAITLNGIAQGFVTDKIAEMLRRSGLSDVLIDFGELRASGRTAHGGAWNVGIAQSDTDDCCERRVTLSDRALATSATFGTVIDDAGKIGHILDPRTGRPALHVRQASVSAPTAAVADGLSTALCAMAPQNHNAVQAAFPFARIEHMTVQAGTEPDRLTHNVPQGIRL